MKVSIDGTEYIPTGDCGNIGEARCFKLAMSTFLQTRIDVDMSRNSELTDIQSEGYQFAELLFKKSSMQFRQGFFEYLAKN